MRLFFAASIPEAVRADLLARLAAMPPIGGVRLSPPESLHVTLRFLGEIDPARLKIVESAGVDVAKAASPFSLSITGAGMFPSARRPSIFWLGLTGDTGDLTGLANTLDARLERDGFRGEERSFRPHLTVARAGRGVRLGAEASVFMSAFRAYSSDAFEVKEIHLFQSHLGSTGSRYELMRTFSLK